MKCTLFIFLIATLFTACDEDEITGPPDDRARAYFVRDYNAHIKQTYPNSFIVHTFGESTKHTGGKAMLKGIKIKHTGELSESEALAVLHYYIEDFLAFMNAYPDSERILPSSHRSPDKITLEISFWTKATDRPDSHYIAHITLRDGQVTCYRKRQDTEHLDVNAPRVFDVHTLYDKEMYAI